MKPLKPFCLWTGTRDARAQAIEIPATDRWGRKTAPQTVHVLPEHADELRAFATQAQRMGRTFLVGVLGLSALTLLPIALHVMGLWSEAAVGVAVGLITAAVGALVIAFPFATPETAAMLGVRRSIRVARWVGALTIVFGVGVAVAALLF
jgi:cation transport ATPase